MGYQTSEPWQVHQYTNLAHIHAATLNLQSVLEAGLPGINEEHFPERSALYPPNQVYHTTVKSPFIPTLSITPELYNPD